MLLFLILLFFASFSFGVEIFSKSLERSPDGTFKAEGDVEAYYRNYYIKADLMTYDPEKRIVYAKGKVYIRSFDGLLEVKGEEALLDLERDVGYFLEAEGSFKRFNFTAKRVDKEGENYTVQEGSITTCPPDRREMKVCFSRADISDKYVVSYNNTLRFFNVPIAYLPFTVFPVGERRSGLLPPMIGSNTYNTFIYQQPIYWAISSDKDATLTFDIRDKQAKGISLEYRQSLKKELDIFGFVSLYKEPRPPGKWWEGRDPSTFRENRYRLKVNIDFDNLKAGIDLISDPYFMQDVYFTTKERTIPYLSSYLSYRKETDLYLFTFDIRKFYDTTSPNNRKTLNRLPEIGFYLRELSLLDFLYFNLTASYTNFYRQEGLKAHRVVFFPEISIPKKLLGFNLLSTITFENLLYLDPKDGDFKNPSAYSSVRYVERLPYVFGFSYGDFKTSNLAELSYSYRPKSYKNPRFDPLDQLNKESLLSYKLRSLGYYKERLFYNLFLEGGYNYLGTFTYLGEEVRESFMPIRSLLYVYPFEGLSLSFDSTYDVVKGRILKSVGSLGFSYRWGSFSVGRTFERSYQGKKLNDQYSLAFSTQYRSAKLSFNLIRDNIINKDLQRQINLDYRGACWNLGLMFRDIYDGTRRRYIKEVFLTFNLFDLQRLTVPLKR
ncbi:MAG: LPS-assembly protein LptD [Aquificaceae bacterium]